MKQKKLWGLFVGLAAASFICGAQVNSAHADKYHVNGVYIGLSIVCGLASLAFGYTAYKKQ
jgi:hypothetical protein